MEWLRGRTKRKTRVDKRNQEWIGGSPERKLREARAKGKEREGAGKEWGKCGANERQGVQIGGRTNIHAEIAKIIWVAPLRFAMFGSAAETAVSITRYRKMTAGVS